MQVLVVYAHPNPQSFNHAIMESFISGLKESRHTYEISDLYAGGFNPVFNSADLSQFTGKEMPGEVLAEQKKVNKAGALVFIYPVWWWAAPAILKGWYDRVLSYGFAYKSGEQGEPVGLLKDKKVLHITTTLGKKEEYRGKGLEEAMKAVDRASFTGVCGIQNVEHLFLYAVESGAETRKEYLNLAYRTGKDF
jgi:NAD(P)H dehydrogenase (quinone)